MARRTLREATIYAGVIYPAGPVEDDMPDETVEALEANGAFDEPEEDRTALDPAYLTDPSNADPDQTPSNPPSGELGDADLSEAPRKAFETRPTLPGATVAEPEAPRARPARPERPARPDRPERPENPHNPDRPARPERPERPERPARPGDQ